MNEQRSRSGLFSTLKRVLKSQGIQYKHLASMLGVSEPTVKRMFQEEDCKFSRLIDICDLVGLSVTDLIELDQQKNIAINQLSEETEAVLAETPSLFSVFILLLNHFSPATIAKENHLSEVELYRYLRELEKLGVVRLGVKNQVHLTVNKPLRWRLGGPLQAVLVEVNRAFITQSIKEHQQRDFPFYSASRLLSERSIARLNQQVDELYQEFHKQATLDQLYFPLNELLPYKLVTTHAPFEVSEYFSVEPFEKTKEKSNAR